MLITLIAIENKPVESLFVELNLGNDKYLINCSYNPLKSLIGNHLDALSKHFKYLDLYSATHEKVIIVSVFFVNVEEKHMK